MPMLQRPPACFSCPLNPISSGFMTPSLAEAPDSYGVALIGEALGEAEAEQGSPFKGPAGFKLTRLLQWAGLDRAKFDIWNVAWCRPPYNKLEGMPYEHGAVEHCKTAHWARLTDRAKVLVPLGNVPLAALTGRKGILSTRGYAREGWGRIILPTVHPSYITRGNSNYAPVLINDVQRAVALASQSLADFRAAQARASENFRLDPSPEEALRFAQWLLSRLGDEGREALLSYDIETPWKGEDEGELESDEAEDDLRQGGSTILRIGFSGAGHTLSIPWSGEYLPTVRALLESAVPKVVWNGGFDTPIIRDHGVGIVGPIHDGMVAWHVLHSDLPKGLGFVATFTCPDQPEWKHLSNAQPAFYNATDARVEVRSMWTIRTALREAGSLWKVYEEDVLSLEPILAHMSATGMPIDQEVRDDRARKLASAMEACTAGFEEVVPLGARRVAHVYKRKPKDTGGLLSRPAKVTVHVCNRCGLTDPKKAHFRLLKKKPNPCHGAGLSTVEQDGEEYYRLAPFSPSKQQLMAYQGAMHRMVPTTFDSKTKTRKPSMNEKAIVSLKGKYPLDKLYPLVLEYRKLQKLASTYIGYPLETNAVVAEVGGDGA